MIWDYMSLRIGRVIMKVIYIIIATAVITLFIHFRLEAIGRLPAPPPDF